MLRNHKRPYRSLVELPSSKKRYVFIIWTQAHFHFFKNVITELEESAEVYILVRKFRNMENLLKNTNARCTLVAFQQESMLKKTAEYLLSIIRIMYYVNMIRPKMILGVGSTGGTLASFIFRIPSIMFEDDEVTGFQQMTYIPFVDHVLVPERFRRSYRNKEIRLKGYKEISYLHPRRFLANQDLLKRYGISANDSFMILRLNAWNAYHDIGVSGIDDKSIEGIIRVLSTYTKVLLSTERDLPSNIPGIVIRDPLHLHHLLAYASLLFTDTQTLATEGAMLGTPVIRCNSFVGRHDMSNFIELETRYGLIYNMRDLTAAIERAKEMLVQRNIRKIWKQKRDDMLKDKIDVSGFLVWLIRHYPQSVALVQRNPAYQLRFA